MYFYDFFVKIGMLFQKRKFLLIYFLGVFK